MAPGMDIHSEAFEELLGEALRCGPGSPEWKQALDVLRAAGTGAGAEGEEYALLCRAREDLESGKQYRSIKAGPGFTRKLMDAIDQQPSGPRWLAMPTANLIAIVAVMVILIAIGTISWLAFSSAQHKRTAAELQEMFFVTPIVDARFDQAIPEDFKPIGKMGVAARDGLRPTGNTDPASQRLGGGVYCTRSLPAEGAYAIEGTFQITDAKTPLIAQLFVTDEPTFSADRGISPRELVCRIEAGRLHVMLPDEKTVGEVPLVLDANNVATLRLKVDADLAVVEHGGKVVWSGPCQLNHGSQYVGLRYLTRGAGDNAVAVRSLRVMKP
jgi:hypothetical protein